MKKGLVIGGIILFILIVVLVLVIVLLPKVKEKKIENISHLYFTYTSGYAMYSYATYIMDCDDKCIVTIKPNGVPDEEKYTKEISKEKLKEIEAKLNEYHVGRWDGFKKSDKYVLDGDSFSFNLKFNDDEITAHGYMMWPNNYSEVKSYLVNTFNENKEEK